MKILIIGNGGREHALAWKISRSTKVKEIFVAPGNAGTATVGKNIGINTTEEIIRWLKKNTVDLVVVGPDHYLAEGLADKIKKLKIPVFGPTKAAAKIEWSKSFAKKLMKEENIPTAKSKVFTNYIKARKYVAKQNFPLVIKASGLAAGKGVIIVNNSKEAESTLKKMMQDKTFGDAGKEVVIEEFLEGEEISIHAFCDGEYVSLFPASQDHKRIFDGDKGPNTGGMGAVTPIPWVKKELLEEIKNKIILPCVKGLRKRNRPFVGVLYPGIMVAADGPKVIEFNARFGDPEAQAYMRILKTDLVDIMLACINKKLANVDIEWDNKSACCLVLASEGYPENSKTNKIISGLEKVENKKVKIFHAGTKKDGNKVVTSGGRVLGITGTGETLKEALTKAYKVTKIISFDGMQFRGDIGKRSV